MGLVALPLGGCFTASTPAAGAEDAAGKAIARVCLTPEDERRLADEVVQLVNLERAIADLPPVVAHASLERVAGEYACAMVSRGFFSHRDPVSGQGPAARVVSASYNFEAVGENLAAGQQTPAEVVRVWMESRDHRAIILDPAWKDIGVAVRSGGEFGIYWVQEFGDPAK
jgi:uncharacterized protein YkwD